MAEVPGIEEPSDMGAPAANRLHLLADREVWFRGVEYADKDKVKVIKLTKTHIKAKVKGTEEYDVEVAADANMIKHVCNCPYAKSHPGEPCKHAIAAGIVWDERRGLEVDGKYDRSIPR